MNNKSAKDLAFDRERARYQKQINDLKTQLNQKEIELHEANKQFSDLTSKCEELQNWVDRLLGYLDMSEDELRTLIQKDAKIAEFGETFFGLLKKINCY